MIDKYYKETKKYIYNYISKYISNKDDVEDLISSIFLKFLGKYDSIKDKDQNFIKNYLFKIVRTKLIDFFRVNKKYQNYEVIVNEAVFDINKTENIDLDSSLQNKLILEKLFSNLNEQEKEILVLKIVDNLTFKEISIIKNMNINTVIWKFNQIIQKLQKVKKEVEKE
ncbi:MAG: RNA polymerase sigma factor [bacterium]|jgi:RNA polymerase sigma-70 factor (ECF subfamily)